ncbi:hypothetical protein BCR34DRAFT_179054 [Clohesyomyces aquaticus]|uniref:Cell wall anchored protein n=1 Tax=Clohesyomyces aquaticus TaxID=1231657 RepID=A0A1Y1ZZ15_9PLEO|nr:hypothetical protein BCR34DRAFT_179054 [Clohesyomyces aquaticus]
MASVTIGARLLALQLLLATLTAAAIPAVWQPYDVVTYFCQRWYHQTVVKDGTLYIHGGIETFNEPGHPSNWTNNTLGYNQFLLQVDLTTSWDWKGNLTYVALELSPNPQTGSSARASVRGAMYQGPANDSKVYIYGGTQYRGNESFPNANANYYLVHYSDQYPLWSFENDTQVWGQYDVKQSWTPSYGAATEAPDQGLAFYLNGRTDNGTSSSTLHDGDVQTTLDGMIVLDLVQHSSRNLSTAGIKNYQPRVGGAMQYAPGVGENGVLVALSGQVFDGIKATNTNSKGRLLTFDTVDVFDIGSYLKDPSKNGTWYSQPTSGDIPPPRVDFCSIIVSAPDNSSHNIFVYGGRDPTAKNETIYYDDIAILSLPSFTWISYYNGKSPRWGHTCHKVGNRQMLTIGGHNKYDNICDWEKKSVAILDLPSAEWGSLYNAFDDQYILSDVIIAKIGGTPNGNATHKVPEKGWASEEFRKIMSTNRIYSNDPVNNTFAADPKDSGLDGRTKLATIAGASIAAFVLIACLCFLTWIYRRHRKVVGDIISSPGSSMVETEGRSKYELFHKPRFEATGTEMRHELPNNGVAAEADPFSSVTYAVELPTNIHDGGRWGIPGVPIIRTPTPAMLRRDSSMADSPDTPQKDNMV